MDTVHAYAHRVYAPACPLRSLSALTPPPLSFPKTAAYIDKNAADMFDWTTYQLRTYFRVHLFHFLVSPLIGGLLIHLHQPSIPFIDCWFSGCAAKTGGSLMTNDVSRLDRFGEAVLYVLMFVGGITVMCVPPALNRLYIFRCKLRPGLLEAIELSRELQVLAHELGAEGAEALDGDVRQFEEMLLDYTLKDEVQAVVATVSGLYTASWHIVGGGLVFAAIRVEGPVLEYQARGITDAWFSIFMICSCLNNVGLALLDDSMFPMVDRPAPLMVLAFAMILGNTAWPIAFRSIVYLLHRLRPRNRALRRALDHPGEGSASLFSSAQTWGLVGAVLVSNIFMMIMFLSCSSHLVRCAEPSLLSSQSPSSLAPPPPPGYSPLPGSAGGSCFTTSQMLYLTFFQVANVRSSGLQVFDLKRISKNMLVIFAFFMWYAPTPLVSIIAGEEFTPIFHDNPILSGFIKKYTNRHTSWIMVAFVVISTAEQAILAESGNWPACPNSDDPNKACFAQPFTTLFNIIFEMLSAYGTNGMSMGFPGVNHSLSGKFNYSVSKLAIMFLMIMGRHRSMSGKSDPTLMPSMRRVQAHVERLRAQRTELVALREGAAAVAGVEEAAEEEKATAVAVATRGELVLEMAELAPHDNAK